MACGDNCTNCDYASNCMGGCITCATAGTCTDSCSGTCMYTCSGTCSGSCSSGCTGNCMTCSANSSCLGSCVSCSSSGNCSGYCTSCAAQSSCTLGCIGCSSAGSCQGGDYATRPSNFTGFTGITSGAYVSVLTATDWNNFMGRIGMFALYKSKGNDITTSVGVSSGDAITASSFNLAVNNLNVLSDYISQPIPTTKSTGNTIYASYYQALKTALNSIT